MKNMDKDIEALLTPEQKIKYEQLRQEQRERFKNRRRNSGIN